MRPTVKWGVLFLCAFAAGLLLGLDLRIEPPPKADKSIAWHWKRVKEYNDYLRDISNYRRDASTGLAVTNPLFDPLYSLKALQDAGELRFVDLVFPNVPNSSDANRFWQKYVTEREDKIPYATGNPQYTDFKPTGTSPLHLKIWFKESAIADIQRLITELEALAAKRTGSP